MLKTFLYDIYQWILTSPLQPTKPWPPASKRVRWWKCVSRQTSQLHQQHVSHDMSLDISSWMHLAASVFLSVCAEYQTQRHYYLPVTTRALQEIIQMFFPAQSAIEHKTSFKMCWKWKYSYQRKAFEMRVCAVLEDVILVVMGNVWVSKSSQGWNEAQRLMMNVCFR